MPKAITHLRRWSAVKVGTVVLMALAIILFSPLYVLYFQNFGLSFVYLPVVIPVALVAAVGIVYSLMKKNYDLLVYCIILFGAALFVGHLFRGIFLPTIIVD
ncbi:MAG: hypothetical protein NT039_02530 [Candidatus Berkelbacteria bacterium]|nr:hypothetical protein [Candidatus Berkelbacteria bacterium]